MRRTALNLSLEESVLFCIVGAASTAIYLAVSIALSSRLNVAPGTASATAFIISATVSYFGQKWLSFRSKSAHSRSAPRFAATALAGFAISVGLPLLAVAVLGLPAYAGFLSAAVVIACISFLLQKYWVFAEDGRDPARQIPEGEQ